MESDSLILAIHSGRKKIMCAETAFIERITSDIFRSYMVSKIVREDVLHLMVLHHWPSFFDYQILGMLGLK